MKKSLKPIFIIFCITTLLLSGCGENTNDSNLTCVNLSSRERLIAESAEPSEPMATLYREINLGGGENITLEPNNSYILFAQEINLNKNGIFGTSAEVSMKEAEFLQKDDAVIALRMDTYTTLEEAEAAVAGIESTQDRRDKEKNESEAQLKAELEAEIVDIIETAMEDTTEEKQ